MEEECWGRAWGGHGDFNKDVIGNCSEKMTSEQKPAKSEDSDRRLGGGGSFSCKSLKAGGRDK